MPRSGFMWDCYEAAVELLGFHTNFEVINGTVRNMLGTMVCHISALPVPMLRQVSSIVMKPTLMKPN